MTASFLSPFYLTISPLGERGDVAVKLPQGSGWDAERTKRKMKFNIKTTKEIK